MDHERSLDDAVRFSGLVDVSHVASGQEGPTCGFEAIESLIRLYRPDVNQQYGSSLSDVDLISRASAAGFAFVQSDGMALHPAGYRFLLAEYGLPSHFMPWFGDGSMPYPYLTAVLRAGRLAMVVAAPRQLDPQTYHGVPESARHALVVSNYVVDGATGLLDALVGIDSNLVGRQVVWPLANFDKATTSPKVWREPWSALWVDLVPPGPQTPFFVRNAAGQLVAAGP